MNLSNISITDFSEIKIEDLKFVNPVKIKGGSYIALANYNDKPLYIQTPKLINNKGFIKNDQRCSLELEFDKTHWAFYEFITNIDDFNIQVIQNNSKAWFSKEFPMDVVEDFYKTPIKLGRKTKPPTLKLKVPVVKGTVLCNIYNTNNNLVTYNDVKIGSKIISVLHLQGIRFLKQQALCEWVPLQFKVLQHGHDNHYLIDDTLLSDNENVKNYNSVYNSSKSTVISGMNDSVTNLEINDSEFNLNPDNLSNELLINNPIQDINMIELNEPKTAEVNNEPKTTEVNNEPKTTEVNNEPKTAEVNNEPKTAEVNNEPKTAEVNNEPKTVEVNNEPKTAEVNNEPKTAEVNNESKTAEVNNNQEIHSELIDSELINNNLEEPKIHNKDINGNNTNSVKSNILQSDELYIEKHNSDKIILELRTIIDEKNIRITFLENKFKDFFNLN